jgi:quaternary ammonium compound-resistance protein SugE
MAWVYLVGAGLAEIWWATTLKKTNGWSDPMWSAITIAGMVISFQLLGMSLKTLPISTAYAVWVGIGAVGVAAIGMLAFGEGVSLAKLAFLAMIVIGVVGLKLAT